MNPPNEPPHAFWSTRVELAGLVSAPELNGVRGLVVFVSAGRLHVLLDNAAPPRIVKVKEANTLPVAACARVALPAARACAAACGADGTDFCGHCRSVFYCSAACQRAHWRAGHRTSCAASIALTVERLLDAAHDGDEAAVTAALDAGAAVSAPAPAFWVPRNRTAYPASSAFNECTALHCATIKNHLAVMELLIRGGAQLEARSANKWSATPLIDAIFFDSAPATAALLSAGADYASYNVGGIAPLHLAAVRSDSKDIIQLLVDHGADVNSVDWSGSSALAKHESAKSFAMHSPSMTPALRARWEDYGAYLRAAGFLRIEKGVLTTA